MAMIGIVRARIEPPCWLAASLSIGLVLLAWPAAPSVAQTPVAAEATATPTGDTRGLNPGFTNVGAIAGSSLAALVRLAPLRDSGVSGEATLLQSGGTTAVAVALDGLAANATYLGYLRNGSCDGPILFALQPIRADHAGHGYATATMELSLDLSTAWMRYDASDGAPAVGGACGPLVSR
jgi:hypothetical protein